jgi:hypothetical protein
VYLATHTPSQSQQQHHQQTKNIKHQIIANTMRQTTTKGKKQQTTHSQHHPRTITKFTPAWNNSHNSLAAVTRTNNNKQLQQQQQTQRHLHPLTQDMRQQPMLSIGMLMYVSMGLLLRELNNPLPAPATAELVFYDLDLLLRSIWLLKKTMLLIEIVWNLNTIIFVALVVGRLMARWPSTQPWSGYGGSCCCSHSTSIVLWYT